MQNPNDIRIKVGGKVFPLTYNMPFTLKQTRGTNPYFLQIKVSSIDGLPAPGGGGTPCSFLFETPAASGPHMIQWEWDSWYLVRVEPAKSEDDHWFLTIADERWKIEHKRIDVSYNVQWPDGSYRAESLNINAEPWTTKDAITDALARFGYWDTIWLADPNKGVLRNNMGNSPAGGYSGGTFSEVLDPMLEQANLDLIIIDRKPAIVERVGDTANKLAYLRTMPRVVDTVGRGDARWELPRKLRVFHEVKMEVALEKAAQGNTTTGDNAFLNDPVNVMPRFVHAAEAGADWWADKDGDTAKSEWVPIDEHIEELFGNVYNPVETTIARNWFLPLILPLRRMGPMEEIAESTSDLTANSLLALRKMVITDYLRKSWRRLWRIEYPTDNRPENASAPTIRRIAGLKLGRLTPGGDATSKGSVFCDWSEQTIHAVKYKAGSPFDSEFGVNHPYGGLASQQDPEGGIPPAPFSAKFISESGKELIFAFEETPHGKIATAEVQPALYEEVPNYGSWLNMVNDEYWVYNQLQGRFTPNFTMRVFLFGRLIANAQEVPSSNGVPAGIQNRSFIEEIDLFPDGGIDSLDVKVESMTANFGFSLEQVRKPILFLRNEWPTLLLNRDKVVENAKRIESQVRDQYQAGDSGGIVTPGVEAMKQGICTAGTIHEASVVVGDPDLWSIRCQFIVAPNIGKLRLEPEEKGLPPAIVDWS